MTNTKKTLLSADISPRQRIRSEMKLDTMIGISEPFRGLRSVRSAYAIASRQSAAVT